ncbi:MAG: MFS transporter [Comamonas sp.]
MDNTSSASTPSSNADAALSTASWGQLLGRQHGLTALALTGAVVMHAINVHIVTTILPSVVEEIGGMAWYAWSTTLFVVASIVGAALSVRLLSRHGARAAMLVALLVFALGTLLCATSTSMPMLLAGRTVQGLGGGTVGALSYTLIRLVFPPSLWPRAIALISAMWGIATLSGPAVGGLFAQAGHWRLAFGALLPLLLMQLLLVQRQLAPSRLLASSRSGDTGIAVLQITLLALSVLLVAAASVVSAPLWQWLLAVAGLLTGAYAIRRERYASQRLLPQGGSSLSHPLGMLYAAVALLLIGTMTEVFVPYLLQHLHGLRPLTAGYVTALLAGGWSAASVLFSGKSGAAGRALMFRGPVLCALALVILALSMPWQGSAALVASGIALAMLGLGVGMAWPHVLNAIMLSAGKEEADSAASAITTVQLYGMAVGAALVGLAANALGLTQTSDQEVLGYSAAWLFGVFAIFPAIAAWSVWRYLRA